jgi:hypothetical protein
MTTARDEMELLLGEGIRVATRFLEKRGGFSAFAVGLAYDGQLRHIMAHTGEEQPEADPHIAATVQALRSYAAKGEIRASALVSDVRIRSAPEVSPGDAIRVQIEHADASPVTCYLPYRLVGKKLQPGELFAEEGESQVFGAGSEAEPPDGV